jgi:uncharacterized membrane protein YgcG
MTYGGRGTAKPGVHPEDHAIIYTVPGRPLPTEGEAQLTRLPICVKPYTPEHKLTSASRLNYAKVYTVEYNVKVWFIGRIHPDSEWLLTAAYNDVHPPLMPRGSNPFGAQSYPQAASGNSSQYQTQYGSPYVPAQFPNTAQTQAPINSEWAATQSHQVPYTSPVATSPWDLQTGSTPYQGGGSSHQQPSYQGGGGGYDDGGGGSSSYQPPYESQDSRYDDLYGDE